MFDASALTRQAEAEVARLAFFSIAIEVLLGAAFFGLLYWVLKSAIRDGINESRLGETWRREVAMTRGKEKGAALPPMRAD